MVMVYVSDPSKGSGFLQYWQSTPHSQKKALIRFFRFGRHVMLDIYERGMRSLLDRGEIIQGVQIRLGEWKIMVVER